MKMVKSLLLGSAAGLVAVVGAQAADLPVKAKPVEYVKICSLYGAGFWYVPGTDTCLKVGSYIRIQSEWGAGNGGIPIGMADGATGGRFTRVDTSDFSFRTRSALSLDLRTQTEYGTLRSYLEVGAQVTNPTNATAGATGPTADAVFIDRGFIQFAGFTAGRIRSFFDINSLAPYNYGNSRMSADTGAAGLYGIAYTAQLGNGFSATLSFEDPGLTTGGRGRSTADVTNPAWTAVGFAGVTNDNRGVEFPDIVGALRVDQAWGYAQVSAAAHENAGGYYNAPFGTTAALAANGCGVGTATNSGVAATAFAGPNCVTNGHPDEAWGWAASVGFTLKNVLGLQGDEFAVQAAYAQGAAGYTGKGAGVWEVFSNNNSVGLGLYADGVFANTAAGGTSIQLTTSWSINAAYQHRWSPNWKTSVYGGYVAAEYNDTATALICGATPALFPRAVNGIVVANCSPDFSFAQAGTRTQWNPHPDLDIGLDLLWTHLNTAHAGPAVLAASGARPAGAYILEDQDVLSAMVRIQRNFLP